MEVVNRVNDGYYIMCAIYNNYVYCKYRNINKIDILLYANLYEHIKVQIKKSDIFFIK